MFKKIHIQHYRANFQLAYPVVIAQMGHMIGGLADTIMVGHISSTQLAASALANSVYIVPMLFGLGILIAITPLISKAFGEKDVEQMKTISLHGVICGFIIGHVLGVAMFATSGVLNHLNQPAEVVKYAVPFYKLFALSMIPYMLFLALKQIAEGLQNTKAGMIVLVTANLINIGLNYLLIYGKMGFPRLELIGAGYATLISRTIMPFMMFAILYMNKDARQILSLRIFSRFKISSMLHILRIGIPIGFQYIFEITSFSLGAIFVGWNGSTQLAAHQIAINIASMTYLMASGIASAATIRVSKFLGEKDYVNIKLVAHTSILMAVAYMSLMSVCIVFGRFLIPSFFVNEKDVLQIAASLFIIMAIFQIFDGSQVVLLGILRGLHDIKFPTYIVLVAYWIIEIPFAYLLGVHLRLGAKGVWFAYLIGLSTAASLLFWRYRFISRRMTK